ncbi:calmodulin-dependent protein kinase [Gigaspora margarita]|uniref:Calmodulin-dependent protein kinase n=1 Tax=Gigaspora margarita TaxID=4874 RepID=A0A8H4AV15_GIGMA|nr:calmodulin-dependent protein kinase [Gigaspora margarita]
MQNYQLFNLYQKSAELGNANVLFNLGHCYQHGIGIEKDENKAFKYYLESAELGNDKGLCAIKTNYNLSLIAYEEFKDVEVIGKGGFSTIYKARWKYQHRWLYVALK